jgi:hypothetical protein
MMENIDFILPTYWQIQDALSRFDLELNGMTFVAFCLGFLLGRVLEKKLRNDMRQEIEALRKRMRGAEDLLTEEKPPELGKEKLAVEGEISHEDALRHSITRRDIKDGHITDEQDIFEGLEPAGLWEIYFKSKHHKVVITKLVGPEPAGETLQTPLSGYELAPPDVGERYQVVLDDGRLLRTSVVTKISNGYIHTHNSLYKVEESNRKGESNRLCS